MMTSLYDLIYEKLGQYVNDRTGASLLAKTALASKDGLERFVFGYSIWFAKFVSNFLCSDLYLK